MSENTVDFEANARARLRAMEQAIAPETLTRLEAARERALTAQANRFMLPGSPWLAGAAMATMLGVAVLLGLQYTPTDGAARPSATQLAENPELYRDLDFYMWLSELEMGNRG